MGPFAGVLTEPMDTTVPEDRTRYSDRRRNRPSKPDVIPGASAPDGAAATQSEQPEPAATADSKLQRAINTTIAVLGLLLTAPLLLILAIAIKLSSPGPVFYRQARIGMDRRGGRREEGGDEYEKKRVRDLGGAPFRIYKFRTMQVDAERGSGAVWAQELDPRVTSVGRVLRQFRLDELPQLFNVIRGDMNIVGPRPERPAIFADMRGKIENYSGRQRTRPGITGLAQINQSYDSNMDDVRRKVEYDLEYISRRGFAEDLRIMLKTIPVILFRRGGW
ncbi:MAG: sugar transferase [Gemmatimonadales bacterium]|nr:MAG: sugar transferase [Gemmatimonadales bacterium]